MRIQDLQQERIYLHRDIHTMAQELGIRLETLKNYEIAEGVRLFPVNPNSEDYPGDTDILGDFSFLLMISEAELYITHKTRHVYKHMSVIFSHSHFFLLLLQVYCFVICD